jgi:hypothetical protein
MGSSLMPCLRQGRHLHPSFLLAQNPDDLLLAEPTSPHRPSLLKATDSNSNWRSFRGAGHRNRRLANDFEKSIARAECWMMMASVKLLSRLW